jgi:hypothetical protein
VDDDYTGGRSAPPHELAAGLRSRSAAFLDGALANPGIEVHHLLAMLRNPAVTPALIQRIARSPLWMKVERLRVAIVLHARTPRRLATGLLPTLRWGDLLRASLASQINTTVRSSAASILGLRLPELATGELVSLARAAPAALVPLLVRESHPRVARALLENPRARVEDALAMVERSDAHPATLKAVAECPRFAGQETLGRAIAAHPRTPAAVALRIVGALDTAALGRLMDDAALPALVRIAVARRLQALEPASRTIL